MIGGISISFDFRRKAIKKSVPRIINGVSLIG